MAYRAAIALFIAACGFQSRTAGDPVADASSGTDGAIADGTDAPPSTPLEVASVTSAISTYAPSVVVPHTIGTSPQRLLVVALSVSYGGTIAASVTYGTATLTPAGTYDHPSLDARVEIWALRDPPSGTANVTVTLVSGNLSIVDAGVVSFRGVSPTAPLGTFVGASGFETNPLVTVPSSPGEIVLDVMSWGGAGYGNSTVGAGQQQRWNSGITQQMIAAGSTQPGAASVAMSWAMNPASEAWAAGAIAIKP